MHAAPGAVALLVGSGISRSAQIPTGWEVALDLARRTAVLLGDDEPADPVAWYVEKFGNQPDYSVILEKLAPSSADRRNLLNQYFEPTAEEREQGVKVPTKAHRAIAELVIAGYVKVIITTNFDRLLEAALQEVGIDPVVIASPAAAAGAPPLAFTGCTIIKLHGDYLDPDLKNTVEELGSYETAIDVLLDRILDEYGLVICGWSGEWDEALRTAILRAPGRRFSSWWALRGEMAERARDVAAHRGAHVIAIADADTFFETLASKITTLAEAMSPRPLSTALAVAELKRYLPDPVHRIRLHDLLMAETKRVVAGLSPRPVTDHPNGTNIATAMHFYEQLLSTLVPLVATTTHFGDRPEHDALIVDVIRHVAASPTASDGFTIWNELERYPGTLALYAAILGGLAGRRANSLAAFLSLTAKQPFESEVMPIFVGFSTMKSLDPEACNLLVAADGQKLKTPVSDYMHRTMREPLRDLIPNDADFDDLFDQAEYLLGVLFASWRGDGRGPIGRFVWRRHEHGPARDSVGAHRDALLAAGLFDGDAATFDEVVAAYEEKVQRSGLSF